MIKTLIGLIMITAFVTIWVQYTHIKTLEEDIAEFEVLFEKVEQRFNELELIKEKLN